MKDNSTNIAELKELIKLSLTDLYPINEINSFIRIIAEDIFNLSAANFHLNQNDAVDPERLALVKNIIKGLQDQKPIQYLIGQTEFYGYTFHVNEQVLIPRSETEELVQLIIRENQSSHPIILDIGTGSGCIPISLKKEIPEANVFAIDISNEALKLAEMNAKENDASVHFILQDILNDTSFTQEDKIDIVVSNPPYVLEKEKALMEQNVLAFEPHLALFVEDEDPLLFYREITAFALAHLRPGGKIYFEINEAYGEGVIDLLENSGFEDVRLKKDLSGKDRMVWGRLR